MPDKVIIHERWTLVGGQRKIGDGPWEDIDLSVYGGRVPFAFMKPPDPDFTWETEKWVTPEYARMLSS